MQGGLEDLQGRINLNLLVDVAASDAANSGAGTDAADPRDDNSVTNEGLNGLEGSGERWNITQKLLIRLLQALGEASLPQEEAMALTDAITDFIDRNNDRREKGAEAGEYRYADFPYLPANRPLASVSELRAVHGMAEPVYKALAPFVTVWPDVPSRLNILTCPLPVLRTLNGDSQLSPLPQMEAERIDALRREGAITGVEDLLNDPALEGQQLAELKPLLDVKSDWFLLDATVELVERERHLFSVLNRREEQVVAVFRSEGEL